ncbi:MAG: hypothetical protein O8C67_09415 [Candidatus Methanoperedens sp.]|nr:hypothetical protein [Candidatus Methanoperedens sp.]
MFEVSKIDDCFPFKAFRPHQRECMVDMINAFSKDIEVYLLNAPVGFGKSPVGIGMGRMTDEKPNEIKVFSLLDDKDIGERVSNDSPFGCYYSTPQKLLQDQLDKDFSEYIKVIKGRDAYRCSVTPGASCKFGKCQTSSYKCNVASSCEYLLARNAAAQAQICCSNFAYLIVVSSFLFGERQLMIVDECHSVPDWGLNYVTCTIKQSDVLKSIPEYKTFVEYIPYLEGVKVSLISILTGLKENKEGLVIGIKERKDYLSDLIQKIDRLLSDFKEHKEEWIYTIVDKGTQKERIRFEPVTVGRFLDNLIWWRGQKILLMSGTIFPEIFVEEAGLTNKVCEYKEIPSTFPVENRPIFYWPAGKMSRDNKEATIPKMVEKIVYIIAKNKESKGFVHCNSYDIATKLYNGLRIMPKTDLPSGGLWLQDRDNREGSLKQWMASKEPSLFFSINMVEGIDLKDDLTRYQICAKIQYPFLGDKRVKARMSMVRYVCNTCGRFYRTSLSLVNTKCDCGGTLGMNMKIDTYTCQKCGIKLISSKEIKTCRCGGILDKHTVVVDGNYWFDAQAVIDLVQSYGRGVRSETDHCEYWVLDESFGRLYRKRYTTFPKYFKEAVKAIK